MVLILDDTEYVGDDDFVAAPLYLVVVVDNDDENDDVLVLLVFVAKSAVADAGEVESLRRSCTFCL